MKLFHWLLVAFWLATVAGGTGVLLMQDFTPGGDVSAPKKWPAQTRIRHAADRPTLIMFAHPQCPCTRASLGELAVLMAQCPGRVDARVMFFQPQVGGDDWTQTDLWRSAGNIPGVMVQADVAGSEAKNFRATTSGHVILYDAQGGLLFSGGITESRGHSGDNAGRSAIVELLNHGTPATSATPVFGCSLVDSDKLCRATSSIWTR